MRHRQVGGLITTLALLLAFAAPAARAAGADAPASGSGPLDCARWRYEGMSVPSVPTEARDDDKVRSERSATPALHDSPHHLCGQQGDALDLAWGVSRGDPHVVLAVLDSGVQWRSAADMADLADKAYLDPGELHGAADRDGDGVLTMADFANDPSVTDRNGNGVLDPEDLILDPAFSDGVDDDHNGYVDDISGWDFLYDDNNPLDDVDYGHGTGEAEDSTAAADGTGSVGTCPQCRFLPVRVGESFVADGARFAAGVLFALDSGASVIQEALGALNNPPQAQRAIDLAYARGVPVVASMADEESKHPNLPAALAHTMPVNAVTKAEAGIQPESYLALSGCTNFGGYTFVSVPSDSCSSGATGRSAGIVGLLESVARGQRLRLSAEEVYQLVRSTADDIDFSTSNAHDPANDFSYATALDPVRKTQRFASASGWDTAHGYGRVNAYELLRAARERRIPPEADLRRPRSFTVLPARGRLEVTGRVAAPRTKSYGYRVEWAAGAQPPRSPGTDSWHVARSVKRSTRPVSGVLATLDLRRIAATLPDRGTGAPATIDGRPDEERFSVRVRVVVTDDRGRVGISQRQVFVHDDPDLVRSFPKAVAGAGASSPVFANLDGRPGDELIVATDDGRIHAFTASGREAKGWPVRSEPVPFWHRRSRAARAAGIRAPGAAFLVGAPVVADLDGKAGLEVAAADFEGTVTVWSRDGRRRARMRTNPAFSAQEMHDRHNRTQHGFASPPAATDLDGDGTLELVAAAMDRHVYAWHADGRSVAGFPAILVDPAKVAAVDETSGKVTFRPDSGVKQGGELIATPSIGDLDGDGKPEIVVGAQEEYAEPIAVPLPPGLPVESGNARVYALHADGTLVAGWPAKVPMALLEVLPTVGDGVGTQAALADLDGDGSAEVVVHAAVGPVLVLDGRGRNVLGDGVAPAWQSVGELGARRSSDDVLLVAGFGGPSIGRLGPDGALAYSAPTAGLGRLLDTQLPDQQYPADAQVMAWDGKTGRALPGFPRATADIAFFVTPAVADLDGDGPNETIAANGVYVLDAFDGEGRVPPGWPKLTGGWSLGTPGLGDLDGDGKAELALTRRDGVVIVWRTKAEARRLTEWPRFGHDGRNTGNATTP